MLSANGQDLRSRAETGSGEWRQLRARHDQYSNGVQGTYTHDPDIAGDPGANIAAMGQIGNQGMAAIKEFVVQSTIGAVTEGIGQGIGIGVDALRIARAAKAAEAAEALAVAEIVTQHAYLKPSETWL